MWASQCLQRGSAGKGPLVGLEDWGAWQEKAQEEDRRLKLLHLEREDLELEREKLGRELAEERGRMAPSEAEELDAALYLAKRQQVEVLEREAADARGRDPSSKGAKALGLAAALTQAELRGMPSPRRPPSPPGPAPGTPGTSPRGSHSPPAAPATLDTAPRPGGAAAVPRRARRVTVIYKAAQKAAACPAGVGGAERMATTDDGTRVAVTGRGPACVVTMTVTPLDGLLTACEETAAQLREILADLQADQQVTYRGFWYQAYPGPGLGALMPLVLECLATGRMQLGLLLGTEVDPLRFYRGNFMQDTTHWSVENVKALLESEHGPSYEGAVRGLPQLIGLRDALPSSCKDNLKVAYVSGNMLEVMGWTHSKALRYMRSRGVLATGLSAWAADVDCVSHYLGSGNTLSRGAPDDLQHEMGQIEKFDVGAAVPASHGVLARHMLFASAAAVDEAARNMSARGAEGPFHPPPPDDQRRRCIMLSPCEVCIERKGVMRACQWREVLDDEAMGPGVCGEHHRRLPQLTEVGEPGPAVLWAVGVGVWAHVGPAAMDECPVEGCGQRYSDASTMLQHLASRHPHLALDIYEQEMCLVDQGDLAAGDVSYISCPACPDLHLFARGQLAALREHLVKGDDSHRRVAAEEHGRLGEESPYHQCTACPDRDLRLFSKESALREHLVHGNDSHRRVAAEEHGRLGEESPYHQCPACTGEVRLFSCGGALERHMERRHDGGSSG